MMEDDNLFSYFDEYPDEDPFEWPEPSDLEHKDRTVEALKDAIEDYLAFETKANLLKIVSEFL